jgi:plasmid stability protein
MAEISANGGALMRTFHLPLPDDLHEALRREATADHRPATEVARDALAGWLQARQRERVAKEIHRFALDFAGTELDIDPVLEQAGVEHLLAGDAR